MKQYPLVSIVIATFNSDKNLSKVLESINKQTYPKNKVEVLIVDGGSKDSTRTLANKYNCIWINNPKTQPVHAKFLGFRKANGKYILYIDHDEEFTNNDSIKNKVNAFIENNNIHIANSTGYRSPAKHTFITNYINEFGDPFSFYIYRLSKNSKYFIPTLNKRYKIDKNKKNYNIYKIEKISNLPIIEALAGGAMIDKNYFLKFLPDIVNDENNLPHLFYYSLMKNRKLLIMKNDDLIHHSSEDLGDYLKKIRWRIKNNIYYKNEIGRSGFIGRSNFEKKSMHYKKYLFIPYAFIFIFPIIDSIVLSFSRKDLKYMTHFILIEYTAVTIVIYIILKIFRYNPKLKSYDEQKEVNE